MALRKPLSPWLRELGASEYEAIFAMEGATTVQDGVESGITEEHLKELGMKLFIRSRVWAAIRALRAVQADVNCTPLQTAGLRVEAARMEVSRSQQRLAEAEQAERDARRLTIHIIGFGTFGQFLAKKFVQCNHSVVTSSRTDYTALAAEIGVVYCRSAEDAIKQHDPQVVVLATSIMSTSTVVKHLPLDLLGAFGKLSAAMHQHSG